ncbi:conserved unknown protein [Ectocarpus siliculosus]|uniref:Spondin domain-containing protein n=1 Tax=Ectocarpus siliculosus TaxID=2880 RepID=D7G3Z4_ECTSI|nr:conserved unknown protein [Ectocarpus siliculosus]|eukprot:CBJ27029.1 conserved unknown protein [Ectocarpus siliculosus]
MLPASSAGMPILYGLPPGTEAWHLATRRGIHVSIRSKRSATPLEKWRLTTTSKPQAASPSRTTIDRGGTSRDDKGKVRVTNLTFKQDFSPPIIVAHEKGSHLFPVGGKARPAIKLMAEDGNNRNIMAIATREGGFCGFAAAEGPLLPGKTWNGEITFDTDKCKEPVYSVVAKLTNTNDAFMGIDGSKFLDKHPSKLFPPAFDAGTEKNNEKCTCMPGRACPASPKSRENHGLGSEGFIHVHRGINGVGDLSKADYGWKNPVAEVVVSKA